MNKPTYRKRRLFPRQLDEVIKAATKPLMDSRGKLYGALLSDWARIVGPERSKYTRPGRLQWPGKEATHAVLHLDVSAAHAPGMAYETQQILEQCARYFGYRAIDRIVIHASHTLIAPEPKPAKQHAEAAPAAVSDTPRDMMDILSRLRQRIEGDDKR